MGRPGIGTRWRFWHGQEKRRIKGVVHQKAGQRHPAQGPFDNYGLADAIRMKRHFSDNFYAQVWWVMARKTVISNVMLFLYGVIFAGVLAYGVGSTICYFDPFLIRDLRQLPNLYAFLDGHKKHHASIKLAMGLGVEMVFVVIMGVAALLRGLYENARMEVLQKMEHDEKARRIGLR